MADSSTSQSSPPPRRNLSERITVALREQVLSGELQPGDRLPTEKELSQAHGVSRAVVREAIAALRYDGLVRARQGSGVFVAEQRPAELRRSLVLFEPGRLSSIIEVLELRAAVESEAAALAAERCSPSELAQIKERHQAMEQAVAQSDQAEAQDFALHLAIVESTHNRQFVEFFRFLGAKTIPRAQARQQFSDAGALKRFLRRIVQEHAAIVEAIADHDPADARKAMSAHLKNSQKRYERLADSTVRPG